MLVIIVTGNFGVNAMKDYNELSEEAKEVVKGMVEYCLNNGCCMGMDEGDKDKPETWSIV